MHLDWNHINVTLVLVVRLEDNQKPSTNQLESHQGTYLYQLQTSIFQLRQEDIIISFFKTALKLWKRIIHKCSYLFEQNYFVYFGYIFQYTYLSIINFWVFAIFFKNRNHICKFQKWWKITIIDRGINWRMNQVCKYVDILFNKFSRYICVLTSLRSI